MKAAHYEARTTPESVSIKQVAGILHVSPSTIRRAVRNRYIIGTETVGGYRFTPEQVSAYMCFLAKENMTVGNLEEQLQFELEIWAGLLVFANGTCRSHLAAWATSKIHCVLFAAESFDIDLVIIR